MICYLLSTAVQLSDVKPNVNNDNRSGQSKEPIRIRKDVAGVLRGKLCETRQLFWVLLLIGLRKY